VIQAGIDKAADQGGGVIYFPPGKYLTGSLKLKSNITLHIDAGATLVFSDNPDDYLPFVQVRWEGVSMKSFAPLLYAYEAENVTIEGRGVLEGSGKKWWATTLRNIAEIKEKGDIATLNEYQKMWVEANKGLKVSEYYENTIKRRFFRPPFFQTYKSKNIRITGVQFQNSPFWTINPEFCDNITIDGITINNPISPNTDGINPESCTNVRIANCHISVGDDCITIKSGRDEMGRKEAAPCENITITNCTMLSGHGGVVIGSEMSGSVRKVTIANCVFDGTDRGIRLKSSRERGGVVEEIRVSNIVMKNIQYEAFTFNLFYDKSLPEGPFSEKTPVFRNIHISGVTATDTKKACMMLGIPESPVTDISFSNMHIDSETGFDLTTAKNIEFHDVTINVKKGAGITATDVNNLQIDNFKTNGTVDDAVISLTNTKNVLVQNCFQFVPVPIFLRAYKTGIEEITFLSNSLKKAKTEYVLGAKDQKKSK
jgi:polygalacturonase